MPKTLDLKTTSLGQFEEPSFSDMVKEPMFLKYWESQGVTPEDVLDLWQATAAQLSQPARNKKLAEVQIS